MQTIIKLFKKYRELIMYCIFGFGTFLVDMGSTAVFDFLFDLDSLSTIPLHACTITATVLAIIFAYVTNRYFVFENHAHGMKDIMHEMCSFFAARIFTLVMSEILILITVDFLGFKAIIMKLCVNILVVILNYVFSKLWIFKEN